MAPPLQQPDMMLNDILGCIDGNGERSCVLRLRAVDFVTRKFGQNYWPIFAAQAKSKVPPFQ